MNICEAITAEPWAITEESLRQIVTIATRHGDPSALHFREGRRDRSTGLTMRGDTAVIPITGPIFKRANLFTEISGATSHEIIGQQIAAALDDSAVQSIVLDIDSPGGTASGTSEVAQLVYDSRGIKPIVAYVNGMAASAAYWIASAADEIVINDTAVVGSIGVVSVARIGKDNGDIEIISSNAPNKRPDPATSEGRAQVQTLVDSLETVFIDTVARNRGMTPEEVVNNFNQGGLVVGSDAIEASAADAVGSLESTIAGLAGTTGVTAMTAVSAGSAPEITLSYLAENHAELLAEIRIEATDTGYAAGSDDGIVQGAAVERERIQSIYTLGKDAPHLSDTIEPLMFDGKTTAGEAAMALWSADKSGRADRLELLRADAPAPAQSSADDIPAGSVDDRCKAKWDSSAEIRAEFGDLERYQAFTKANEAGRIRSANRAA